MDFADIIGVFVSALTNTRMQLKTLASQIYPQSPELVLLILTLATVYLLSQRLQGGIYILVIAVVLFIFFVL